MRIGGHLVRLRSGGADIHCLGALGVLSGVQITLIGALNGPGRGYLSYLAGAGLKWKAPGARRFGAEVDVSAGGKYYVLGDDPDQWLAVRVTPEALPRSYFQAAIDLVERYNVAAPDVDAGGQPVTYDLVAVNMHDQPIADLTAWLDPDVPANRGVTLTPAGGAACQPFSEDEGRALFGEHNLAYPGGALVITFTRTPDSTPSPRRRLRGWLSWNDGAGGRARAAFCALYRVAGTAGYELYRSDGAEPVPGVDAPLATVASLPSTPVASFTGDASHRLAICRCNRFGLRCTPQTVQRIDVADGAVLEPVPPDLHSLRLIPTAPGKVRVLARVRRTARPATRCAIWYTLDDSPPGAGEPQHQAIIRYSGPGRSGIVVWDGIPPQPNGTRIRVAARAQRGTRRSDNALSSEYWVIPAGIIAPVSQPQAM